MIKLLSHLSYISITTPDVEASVKFYEEEVGLTVVDRVDGRVYLRCWGDYYAYSVVVVPGDEPTLETMAWRTSSEEALDEAVKRIEAAGVQGEWFEAHKIGRAYRFVGPQGHPMTLHWNVTRHQAPGHTASIYPDRPEKRSKIAGAPRQARPRHDRCARRRRVREVVQRGAGLPHHGPHRPRPGPDLGVQRADHQREVA